jgi:1-acyl-sn-glycerol-3-phosphate acyltransferase
MRAEEPKVRAAHPLVILLARLVVTPIVVVYFRLRVKGGGSVPRRGPLLLVANHASHLDPPIVGCSTLRRVSYLARSSLFRPAPFGWLIRTLGAVPIERKSTGLGGIRATRQLLAAGGAVVVFPEGTRSTDGRPGELREGFIAVAKHTVAEVQPVWIEGSHAAFPRGARIPRPRSVQVRFGAPFRVPEGASNAEVVAHVRDQWGALSRGAPVPAPGGQLPSAVNGN